MQYEMSPAMDTHLQYRTADRNTHVYPSKHRYFHRLYSAVDIVLGFQVRYDLFPSPGPRSFLLTHKVFHLVILADRKVITRKPWRNGIHGCQAYPWIRAGSRGPCGLSDGEKSTSARASFIDRG